MSQDREVSVKRAPEKEWQLYLGYSLVRSSAALRSKILNLSALAEFHEWKKATFAGAPLAKSRTDFWKKCLAPAINSPGAPWRVFEFGVAWGYTTNWWLSRSAPETISEWHGFDRFEGLPRAWRSMPAGTFSADGKTPLISDDRVAWYVGDVEDTLDQFDFSRSVEARTLYYFDFDIYEPTHYVWERISPYLALGDLLYFDEAAYPDERRVLVEDVMPGGDYRLLGSSPEQILLCVNSLSGGASSPK